jgi:predicted naringenin-chalcone synthase
MILSDFHILRPPYESDQASALNWLIDAHTEAEKQKNHPDLTSFAKELKEKMWRIGCKPDRIEKRGHILRDYLHSNWADMDIYNLEKSPSGESLSTRAEHFDRYVDTIFETYYPQNCVSPGDLIHVSCTGYVAPSGAQKIASRRNWGSSTTITHAYHMGCYGSIPAIRMACGFLALEPEKKTADIVHTEVCSLHVNPELHGADQLVSQSLFADGFIKYSVQKKTEGPHLKILALQQEIIPDSIQAMTWNVVHWGFKMSLAKEVPVLIARSVKAFVESLAKKGNREISQALFAVHPGGPKILTHIADCLTLQEHQLLHSANILKLYGNMSSATLPHIWESILRDPNVKDGTPIISLAFGPGLSITGSMMEKNLCGC